MPHKCESSRYRQTAIEGTVGAMNRQDSREALALLLLLLLLLLDCSAVGAAGARHKRFVAFRKGSTFFYRLNYKIASVPYTTLFAQASGFKVAWELPSSAAKQPPQKKRWMHNRLGRSISARDIQDAAELLYESHGFDGKMCLLKSLCQVMDLIKTKDQILMKILMLLFGSYSENGTSGLDPLVCRNYANHCPLNLIGFSAFTEQ